MKEKIIQEINALRNEKDINVVEAIKIVSEKKASENQQEYKKKINILNEIIVSNGIPMDYLSY